MKFVLNDKTASWEIKKMPDVVKWGSGGTPKATVKEYYESGTIPWLIIGDLNDGIVTKSATKITKLGLENSSAKLIPKGTLLVAMYGSIGKLGITGIECCTNQAIAYAKELHGVTTEYMYYHMALLKSELISKGKGGTQKNISQTVLNSLDVIVPPLEEQKRIVARIEELFSELDAAVATLERTKEQLAVYRQAVLKEAFSGTFSKHWREENTPSLENTLENIANLKIAHKNKSTYIQTELVDLPLLPPEWKWISIGDISKGVEYGTSKKSEKEGLTAVIRMGNIQNGKIIWDDLVYSNDEEDIVKYQLKKGDVLFNRTNSPELVGKTAVYVGEQPAIFAGYLIRINHFECINSQYLTYYLNGFTAKQYGNKVKTDGVNQSNINGKKLCSYPFPLCTIEEQEYIVSEIESRLSVCDKIEETVTTALQEAEAMRQSILKQAFAGEL